MQELDFEKQIVEILTTGKNQWVERKDLYMAEPEKLWANLREKINNNNFAKLQGIPLTDKEFNQIKRAIEVPTPYQAAKILAAENGIGKVEIERDNAQKGKVILELFWKADVAGGKSSYEVVRQAVRPKVSNEDAIDRDRRFDVTLLINGLPLIQLEFKKSTVELNKAFNEIKKYAKEGKYTGIYSLLQMFVIMSPDSSAYFANAKPEEFNKSFIFRWRTPNNHPVENGVEFTKQVLNIPMAHKLVGEYTVMDEERKRLILLRPYQIYAIEKVMKRIHEHRDGFVWHTTGSGKTLTSYKTAKLAAQDPSVDRVVFLVDRKDLDEQTTNNFSAYAANDDIDIKEAKNTSDLIRKLRQNDGKLLVTSIQKLYRAIKKERGKATEEKQTRFGQTLKKRIILFVDEAHRSQFGKMQKEIRETLVNSNWYGYTGTPIFAENKKQTKGELAVTTEELFGKVCHTYNLRDALEDHAVLPFNVEHVSTVAKETLIQRAVTINEKKIEEKCEKQGRQMNGQDKRELLQKIGELSTQKLEKKYLQSSDFETNDHIKSVIQYILENGPRKMSLGHGNYNAILTTSSIEMAQKYYCAFKDIKKNYRNTIDSDWPRVAVTFSLAENEDNGVSNQQQMKQILKDYNQQYHTRFGLADLDLYNEDVAKRLARREAYYTNLDPSQEINLAIVVRRLLTGFDAPRLNTLFVDRKLSYQELIQSYSRTNRLHDRDLKQEGQIVTFRMPATMEENEKEAYRLYSGEGSFDIIMRPNYKEAVSEFRKTVVELKKIASCAGAVDDLKGTTAKVQFVKSFRKLNRELNSLTMYKAFNWENGKDKFGIEEDEIEHYIGKYLKIRDEVIHKGPKSKLDDLDFSVSIGSVVLVDYDYLTQLIQDQINEQQNYMVAEDSQNYITEYLQNSADIQANLKKMAETEPEQAALIQEALPYIEQKMIVAKKNRTHSKLDASDLLDEYREKQMQQKISVFAKLWGLNSATLLRVAQEHVLGTNIWKHEQALTETSDAIAARKEQKNSETGLHFAGPLPLYRIKAQQAWRNFIENDLAIYLHKQR